MDNVLFRAFSLTELVDSNKLENSSFLGVKEGEEEEKKKQMSKRTKKAINDNDKGRTFFANIAWFLLNTLYYHKIKVAFLYPIECFVRRVQKTVYIAIWITEWPDYYFTESILNRWEPYIV